MTDSKPHSELVERIEFGLVPLDRHPDAVAALQSLVEQLEAEKKWGRNQADLLTDCATENERLKEQYEGALATIETLESKEELSALIASQTEEIESLEEQYEELERDRDGKGFLRDAAEAKIRRLEEQNQSLLTERAEGWRRIEELERLRAAAVAETLGALEQYQTALDRLWEAHDQLCGCDKPADEGRCSAPEETWGAFEYLGERDSNPASSLDDIDPRDLGDGMEATVEPGDEMTEADLDAFDSASRLPKEAASGTGASESFEDYDYRMAGVPDE